MSNPFEPPIEQAPAEAPPPKVEVARSLDEVRPGQFLHVDGKGQVRSPWRQRLVSAGVIGAAALALAAVGYGYVALLGDVAGVVIVVAGGVLVHGLLQWRRVRTASALVVADRLDEAEALLWPLSRGPLSGAPLKGLAHMNLASVANRRGEHALALDRLREARRLLARRKRFGTRMYISSCRYMELIALLNLGQIDEAEAGLRAIGGEPEGDYLKISHWETELLIDFSRGSLRLDPARVRGWAERVESWRAFPGLLALLSWALEELEDERAEPLLRHAFEAAEAVPMQALLPSVWRWMQARRPQP